MCDKDKGVAVGLGVLGERDGGHRIAAHQPRDRMPRLVIGGEAAVIVVIFQCLT